MNVAFFFNCSHPDLRESIYSFTVFKRIFQTGFKSEAGRFMRISHGDILLYTVEPPKELPYNKKGFHKLLFDEFYSATEYDRLKHEEIEKTFYKAEIYCVFLQNISMEIAEHINNALLSDSSYLGAKDIVYSKTIDFNFIKKRLVEIFMLHERHIDIYYESGLTEADYKDVAWEELFTELGYEFAYLEQGLRNTIFDEYNDIKHFKKIEKFQIAYFKHGKLSTQEIDDLIFHLEDINQSLFNKLYASTKVASEAITIEEISLASLAGRRFIEALADTVFEPRDVKFEGMSVKKESYINRIMAYVFIQTKDKQIAESYRQTIFDTLHIFQKGVHKKITAEEFYNNLDALLQFLLDIIKISPYAIRNLYIAYEEKFLEFFKQVNDDTTTS